MIDEYRGKKLLTGGEVKDVDLPMQVFDRRFFDAVLRVKPDIDVHIRIDINGKDQSKSIKVGDRVKVVGEIEHIEFGDAYGDRVELIGTYILDSLSVWFVQDESRGQCHNFNV